MTQAKFSDEFRSEQCGVQSSGRGSRQANFRFGTKAETLERIAHASTFRVLPLRRIAYGDWLVEREREVDQTRAQFNGSPLIVRSSSHCEDGRDSSHAGEFESLLNVSGDSLEIAIDSVFRSYGSPVAVDEVLVQPMASGLTSSGVAMTCDPLTGSPYFVVNHHEGEDTEAVTSGDATSSWSIIQGRKTEVPDVVGRIVDALNELMRITGERHLDVEFGVTEDNTIVVFQLRRVTTVDTSQRATEKRQARLAKAIDRTVMHYRVAQRHAKHIGVENSLMGVMPDWNPAELIGLKPRPLAYSLYESMITSDAWAVGRHVLGYKNLRVVPLMHRVGGTPYILVAASLLSFVPDQIPDALARQIIDTAERRLRDAPDLHDKVEFAVMPTCFKPSLRSSEWRERFTQVSDHDWATYLGELLRLTNAIVGDESVIQSALTRSARLRALAYQTIPAIAGSASTVDAVALLRSARVHGTELFSEVARAAFIATDILADLERAKLVPPGTLDGVVAGASTVGSRLLEDHSSLAVEDFLQRHGHIRPGTYDITVPRYDAAPERYFRPNADVRCKSVPSLQGTEVDIDRTLAGMGYTFTWTELVAFARGAIALREEVKHSFTKLLSDAMEVLVSAGARSDLGREDVSYLTLSDIVRAEDFPEQRRRLLTKALKRNRKQWRSDLAVRLPELLTSERDIFFNAERVSRPTFVTRMRVQAPVRSLRDADLAGSVIFLDRADPGFDWLFTRGISGFITRFGGENSHMAIRARELGIPAVIGAGSRFDQWSRAKSIRIDGVTRTVEVLA